MALPVTAAFLAVLSFFASCAAQKNCSEVQCELLPVGEDFAAEFQFKASEKGVRMVYLNLRIGNESYQPLELGNEFLPERWVWAASIGELMLSLSYDYDILSLGLLKNQVRKMSVQLNDQPSGCLASLNSSSCKNKVVGRVLLGNVTTSSGKTFRLDVVCVAVINDQLNLLENFFEGDVEYRCCKMVKLGVTDSIQCEQRVERSNWFKAFYIVLNILTVFVAIYLPALFLFALPDFIFNLRKEYEKEKEDKRNKRRGTEDPWKKFAPVLMGEWRKFLSMMRSNWLPMRNKKDYLPIPGSTGRETETVPLAEITSARHKARKFTHFRREDRIPVDDGSPFTISRLLHMCNSGAEAFQGLVKLSFNIKLLILWYYIMPSFVIIEFVLYQTVKDEFFEELTTKRKAFLVGKLFFLVDMSKQSNQITLIVSYVVFPSFVIMILKKGDFIEKEKPCLFPFCTKKLPRYIDKEVWNHLEIIPKKVSLVFPYIAKFPIMVWLGFQIFCSRWISDSSDDGIMKRIKRYMCSWFVLILTPVTLVLTAALTAIVWFVFLIFIIILLIICTPQVTAAIFFVQKWLKKPKYLLTFLLIVCGWVLITLILKIPLKYSLLFHVCFSIIYPIFLGLHFCRFIVRMFGFTIIGLTLNAEIAAPLVTFAWLITSNMHECLCNFQGLYRDVKQMIYQEWQKGIEKLDEKVRPKSTNGTFPADLFWYVCNESKVLPVWREVFRMLCNMIVIFLSAFFALTAIFFGTNKYQIPTVASTIAVYVSGEFPMLLLREMHKLNFSGWKKIERNEKVRMSVNEFITKNYDSRRKRCATI